MPRPLPAPALTAFCLLLAALGAAYTGLGIRRLTADVTGSFPVDLRLRWMESRLLVEGRNTQRVGHPDALIPASHEIMRRSGGAYPPWSYLFGLLFVPPAAWWQARYYFAALNLLALGAVGWFAWARAGRLTRTEALVAAVLPFTSFPAAICLSYGQYGVVVTALVAGAIVLLERGHGGRAGLVLGLSLVKPQLAAPFCIALAATRRWRACLAAGLLLAGATLAMAAMVGETPGGVAATAVTEMRHARASSNPLLDGLSVVMHQRHAVVVLGLAATALMAALAASRPAEPFPLACLSVVVAMFWTHRKHFDASLMTLPLVWLWLEAMRTKRPADLAVFLAVGLTLWAPLRDAGWDLWWVQAVHLAVWAGCGAWIYRRSTA